MTLLLTRDCPGPRPGRSQVKHNSEMAKIEASDAPDFAKSLQKLPHLERVLKGCIQLWFWPTKQVGSLDMEPEMEKNWVY